MSIQRSSLAHDRRNLGRRVHEHPDFVSAEIPRVDCLNNKNTLENTTIDERNSQE